MIWWLTACLGTMVPQSTEVGIYRMVLPEGLEPIDLGTEKRNGMFAARFRAPKPAPDLQVIVARPTPVSSQWPDGGLPQSATKAREQVLPITHEPATWLDGEATLGVVRSPDGKVAFMWAAVRDGWLHEFQCTGSPDDAERCQLAANSVELARTPGPLPPVAREVVPRTIGALTVSLPVGWQDQPEDPTVPARVLHVAEPPPPDAAAPRAHGNVTVEVHAGDLLGTYVDSLREEYGQAGMTLIRQEMYRSPVGEAFSCEYSDGITTAFTVDAKSAVGLLHIECTGNVAQRTDVRILCSKVFESLELGLPGRP